MQANDVALLVMAGGRSDRFGPDNKLLARLGERALGLHAARRLGVMDWGRKLAVAKPPLDAALADLGYSVIDSPAENGLGDNLALGARHLGDVAGVLIVLADMPFVTQAHVRALLAAGSPASVVCTRTDDLRSPPVLIGRDYVPDLRALSGDEGARALLRKAGPNLIEVAADTTIAADIDTPQDLQRWRPAGLNDE